ncbi:DUF6344 domain-containing protein [Streptomyces sp. NPDC003090]|uniref:DUF6344 domain-containing protein n=2 Tax=unclassified Streptomyces TaxID=2593676 RepID=UPI0038104CF5
MGKRGAMAADKVKQFWTAIVSFFCGVLAALRPAAPVRVRRAGTGFDAAPHATATAPATSTSRGLARAVGLPAQRSATAAEPAAGRCGSGWGRRTPRERALPPTIKQRIHAEAHGASPAVRRLTTAGVLAADHRPAERATDDEEADAGVPVGAASAH